MLLNVSKRNPICLQNACLQVKLLNQKPVQHCTLVSKWWYCAVEFAHQITFINSWLYCSYFNRYKYVSDTNLI